jgi:hypothetical protein
MERDLAEVPEREGLGVEGSGEEESEGEESREQSHAGSLSPGTAPGERLGAPYAGFTSLSVLTIPSPIVILSAAKDLGGGRCALPPDHFASLRMTRREGAGQLSIAEVREQLKLK